MTTERTTSTDSDLTLTNFALWGIGAAIGFALTFWLGFGIMMELSPLG